MKPSAPGQLPDPSADQQPNVPPGRFTLPIEVEIYIEADGSVTFADLEDGLGPVAQALASQPEDETTPNTEDDNAGPP